MTAAVYRRGDGAIRWTTTICVVVLAGIAAVISYKHMYELVIRYGEESWTAALLPVSVDGMIAASSMTLLSDSRNGRRSGVLPWTLLVIGSAASLAANVAVAEPSVVGRLIAAWPSCALIGSYELLMRQVRHAAGREVPAVDVGSGNPVDETASSRADASLTELWAAGGDGKAPSVEGRREQGASGVHADQPDRPRQASVQGGRTVSPLQQQAWEWALANRTPDGDLPSGKAIAEQFDRRERWGRMVKQAGLDGSIASCLSGNRRRLNPECST